MIWDYKDEDSSKNPLGQLRSAFRLPVLETEAAIKAAESMAIREKRKEAWDRAGVKKVYPWMVADDVEEKEKPATISKNPDKEPTFLDKVSDVRSLRLLEKFVENPLTGLALGEVASAIPGLLKAHRAQIGLEEFFTGVSNQLGRDAVRSFKETIPAGELPGQTIERLTPIVDDMVSQASTPGSGFKMPADGASLFDQENWNALADLLEKHKKLQKNILKQQFHEAAKGDKIFNDYADPTVPMNSEELQVALSKTLQANENPITHLGLHGERNPQTGLTPNVEALLSPVRRSGLGPKDISGLRGELIDKMTKKYGPSPSAWKDDDLLFTARELSEQKYGLRGPDIVSDWIGGRYQEVAPEVTRLLSEDALKVPAALSRTDTRFNNIYNITENMFADRPYSFSLGRKIPGGGSSSYGKIFTPEGLPILDVNASHPFGFFALAEREIIANPKTVHFLKEGKSGVKYLSTEAPSLSQAEENFMKMYRDLTPIPQENLINVRQGLNPTRHPGGEQLLYGGDDIPMIDKDFAAAGEHYPLAITNKNMQDAYADLEEFIKNNPEALLRVYASPGGLSAFDVGKYSKLMSPSTYYKTFGPYFKADPMYAGLVHSQQNFPVRLGQKIRTLEEDASDFVRIPIDLMGKGTADPSKVAKLKWLDQQFFSGPKSIGTGKAQYRRFFPQDIWNNPQRDFVVDQIALLGPEKAAKIIKFGLGSSLLGTAGMTLMPQGN